jgi:hypothetical protein
LASPSALWNILDRLHNIINLLTASPNLPAISAVVANGMTVNVPLIISVERFAAVIAEWVAGLNQRWPSEHVLPSPLDRLALRLVYGHPISSSGWTGSAVTMPCSSRHGRYRQPSAH